MGFEAEKEPSRLPLFSSLHAHMVSPERPGTLTPPLRASASVPFRWEEEPGKPKAYTTVATFSDDFARKCLELPPRLLLLQEANKKKTNNNEKLCSTTTVLDGPYLGRARFQSSSFRMVKSERYGSFSAGSFFPENMVLERGGVSVSIKRMKKRGSLNSLSHSKFHFWASIYEGLKQVVPWNIREKKDRHMGADF
ncbi:uncharacterized protein At4g00950-like isoform X2 [Hibiscus syriacus]|uniref:uncharacterized protein At4g00950-like isoform X2 n=1 Tax=Hibiscus syriacus TaxID=106335 RepID=UPI001920E50F|nr:uncharacterized protein At4g00950-like isoform X2 [Hibiscus syriacus]